MQCEKDLLQRIMLFSNLQPFGFMLFHALLMQNARLSDKSYFFGPGTV